MQNTQKVRQLDPLDYLNQPEDCFHNLLAGKGRLTVIRSLASYKQLRYTEIKQLSAGLSSRVLSLQLTEMEKLGLIGKKIFAGYPKHTEYFLTEFGKSLLPIIDSITDWYKAQYQGCDCKRLCGEPN